MALREVGCLLKLYVKRCLGGSAELVQVAKLKDYMLCSTQMVK